MIIINSGLNPVSCAEVTLNFGNPRGVSLHFILSLSNLQNRSLKTSLLELFLPLPTQAFFLPEKVKVIIEGNIIITMPTLAEGYMILFGLMYALHLHYPKGLANTFYFLQKVLMGLKEGQLKHKVLSLKNDLLTNESFV